MYGATVMQGVDGAGLPPLPDMLPQVPIAGHLPRFQGSEEGLRAAVEQTVWSLRETGAVIGAVNIGPQHKPFWARPIWEAVIQADCYEDSLVPVVQQGGQS
ncbi:MAG: hypothetical protein IT318_20110 [Anaerolineales bacterium]|nr:hypothetical protein [Anaerolineales bacterium]